MVYELIFIVGQNVSTAEVENITSKIVTLIEEQKGSVIKKEYWELRTLAYKIDKNKKGHYVFLGIDISSEGLNEVQRKMKFLDEIIRISAVRVDKIDPEPSPILKNNAQAINANVQASAS